MFFYSNPANLLTKVPASVAFHFLPINNTRTGMARATPVPLKGIISRKRKENAAEATVVYHGAN